MLSKRRRRAIVRAVIIAKAADNRRRCEAALDGILTFLHPWMSAEERSRRIAFAWRRITRIFS